jgi:DNA polymerase-3 subunit gamma/tau
VEELMSKGHDMKEFLAGLLEHFRNIMIVKATGSAALLEVSDVYRKRYEAEAGAFSIVDMIRYQRHINTTEFALKNTIQPRFRLEADMVQLVTLPKAEEISTLIEGVEELKKKVADGRYAPSPVEPPGAPRGNAPAPAPGRGFGMGMKNRTPAGEREYPPPAAGRVVSAEEVQSRWTEILSEVARQRISLKAPLEASVLLGVVGNVVRVGFADEFQASHIQRNREFLSGLMERVLQVPVRLEAIVDPRAVGGQDHEGAAPSAGGDAGKEDDPILQVLRKELGAEPLE